MDDRGKDAVRDLVTRGREHYTAREYDKAETLPHARSCARTSPTPTSTTCWASSTTSRGASPTPRRMFRRALEINPAYTEAALNLAVTYNDLGKYREAKEVYQRALAASKSAPRSLDPFAKGKIANMHADTGAAYHAVGMYADAVREYQRALTLCPTFVDIRTRLGTTLREMGDTAEAVGEFERVRAENPRFLPARLHLGLCYYAHGPPRRRHGRVARRAGDGARQQVGADVPRDARTEVRWQRRLSRARRRLHVRSVARALRRRGDRGLRARRRGRAHVPLDREARADDDGRRAKARAAPATSTARDVGYAGLKDRHAVTRQWLSVAARRSRAGARRLRARSRRARGHPTRQQAAHRTPARQPLRARRLTLREDPRRAPGRTLRARAWRRSAAGGVPNRYGEQRFGAAGDNAAAGLAILRGERRERDHRLRKLLLSAAQSAVFNRVLDAARRETALCAGARRRRAAEGRPRAASSSPRTSRSTSAASTPASSPSRGRCRAAARRSRRPARRRAPLEDEALGRRRARRARTSRARAAICPARAGRSSFRSRSATPPCNPSRRPRVRRGGRAPEFSAARRELRHGRRAPDA